jgi:hypothetical protein
MGEALVVNPKNKSLHPEWVPQPVRPKTRFPAAILVISLNQPSTSNMVSVKHAFVKSVLRTPHLIEAQSLRDFLASRGVESFMMNENGAFYAQGSIHAEVMPEVCVTDSLFENALSIKMDWKQQCP